ncbi:MAG: hypothetical protein WCO56_15300 [Verrucomicrobiota bacterium]
MPLSVKPLVRRHQPLLFLLAGGFLLPGTELAGADALPQPNPYARSPLVHTSKGRQVILDKLNRIHLDEVSFDKVRLAEVVKLLGEESKKRDPDKQGINFLFSNNVDLLRQPAGATGEAPNLDDVPIQIQPPMSDLSLFHVLEIMVKVSNQRIKYSVEEYGVVFSWQVQDTETLYTRVYRVDGNTFVQGLENVSTATFGGGNQDNRGGQGGNASGGMATYAEVNIAGNVSERGNGGSTGPRPNSISPAPRANMGTNDTARQFFQRQGINLAPPRSYYFNETRGLLMVRGTTNDHAILEKTLRQPVALPATNGTLVP